MRPVILYVEVPNFYASVERARTPEAADRPVLVGGDPRKRGVVKSATPEARAAGVVDEMPMLDALVLCPRARVVRTEPRRYREAAKRLHACLRRPLERLETLPHGAAYLDATGCEQSPEALAATLRGRVQEELGLPLRVGIAPVKFVARLAAEEAGEGGVRRIADAELRSFLDALDVERLPGVGPNTAGRLAELGARTVGELARLDRDLLERALGNHGRTIWGLARGRDDSPIRLAPHPRTLSQESSFSTEQIDLAALSERIQALAQALEEALAIESLSAGRVALKLGWSDRSTTTRRRTLERAVVRAEQIRAVAEELLHLTAAGERPVRLVGLALSRLLRRHRDDRQLELFSETP